MRLTPLLTSLILAASAGLSATAATYEEQQTATLRALDKITGRSTDFEIKVGEPVIYGSMKISLDVCFQRPPEEPPESVAFLQIETANAVRMQSMTVPRLASEVEADTTDSTPVKANGEPAEASMLFSGWMFASTPGLSALEHPVYDVWVIRCSEPSPESLSSPVAPDE